MFSLLNYTRLHAPSGTLVSEKIMIRGSASKAVDLVEHWNRMGSRCGYSYNLVSVSEVRRLDKADRFWVTGDLVPFTSITSEVLV